MVLEQGALTGQYNEAHPFPAGTGRGDSYNPHLKELSALIEELTVIGTRFDASPAQVATAWAIAKGTLGNGSLIGHNVVLATINHDRRGYFAVEPAKKRGGDSRFQ